MIAGLSKALIGLPLLLALAQETVYSPVQAQYDEAVSSAVTDGIAGLVLKLDGVANAFPGTQYAARARELIQMVALAYPGSVPNHVARLDALRAQVASGSNLARVVKRVEILRAYYAAALEGHPETAAAALDDPVLDAELSGLSARADAAFRARDYRKAEALGYQAVESDPRSPLLAPTFVMLGLIECYRGNAAAGARLFQRAAAVTPLPTLYGSTQEYLAGVYRFARPTPGSVSEIYNEVRFTRIAAPGIKEPQSVLFHEGKFLLVDREGILVVSSDGKLLESRTARRVEDLAGAPSGRIYYLTREALDLGSGTLVPVSATFGGKQHNLRKLRSIAVDGRGDIYLLDDEAGLLRGTGQGSAIKWSAVAPVRGHLVRVDRRGFVYVLAGDQRSVQVLSRDGKPLTTVAPSPSGAKEADVAFFALDALNHLFLLDSSGSSIQIFAINETAAGVDKTKVATLQLDARNPQQKNLRVVAVSPRGETVVTGKNEDNWVTFF
jgi:hypothetical protein